MSIIVFLLLAVPLRPLREPEPQPPELLPMPILKLEGKTNRGIITQNERSFVIVGSIWTGTGKIQPDGRLEIWWTSINGVSRTGVYHLDGARRFSGHWACEDECEILGNGNLVGDMREDNIRWE